MKTRLSIIKKLFIMALFVFFSFSFPMSCRDPQDGTINVLNVDTVSSEIAPKAVQTFTHEAVPMNDGSGKWQVKLIWERISTVDSYSILYSDKQPLATPPNNTLNKITSPLTISNLAAGSTLYFTLTAVAKVNGSEVTVPSAEFSVKVPIDAYTEIPGPFKLTALAGDQEVTLSWDISPRATFYMIYSGSRPGGPYETQVASLATSPYLDRVNLVNGITRYYIVKAVNSKGTTNSTFEVEVTPNASPPNALGAISLVAGTSDITLSWQAVSFATKYRIQRGIVSGQYQDPTFEVTQPALLTDLVTYVDTGLILGQTYYYLVSALNDNGTVLGQVVSGTLLAAPYSGPLPGAFSANISPGDNQTSLSWGSSTNALTYSIYRGTATGIYNSTPLVSDLTNLSYIDTTAVTGIEYFYLVTAVNPGGSTPATEVSTTPYHLPLPFEAQLARNGSQVTLTWNAAVGATSYSISRKLEGASYSTIAQNLTGLTYLDSTGLPGGTYFYLVLATNTNGNTTSNELTTTLPVTVSASGDDTQIQLSWSAPAGSTSTYSISRSTTSGSNMTSIATEITATQYLDTGLTNGTTYYYQVTVNRPLGLTILAQEVSAIPQIFQPQLLYRQGVTSGGGTTIEAVTTDTQGNVYVSGYTVSYATLNNVPTTQNNNGYLSKRDSNGNHLWTSLMPYYGDRAETYAFSHCHDGIGNTYVVGSTSNGQQWTSTRPIWAKFDTDGNQQWIVLGAAFGVNGSNGDRKCVASSDGTKLFITGYDVFGRILAQPYLASLNPANGQQNWRVAIPVSSSIATVPGLSIDLNSNIFLCGTTAENRYYFAKYNSTGDSIFLNYRGPSGVTTTCSSALQDGEGGIYFVGGTSGAIEGLPATGSNQNIFVSKFTTEGSHLSTLISPAPTATSLDVVGATLDSARNSIYITGNVIGNFAQPGDATWDSFFTRFNILSGTFDKKLQWGTDIANNLNTAPIALDTVYNRIYVPAQAIAPSATFLGSSHTGVGTWADSALLYIPRP